MTVLISWWRPVSIFESRFNSFAAWCTGGEFCHADLCLHVEPGMLTSALTKAMALNDSDCNLAIEECFFSDPAARQKLNGSDKLYVSFSALWGMRLSARVLRATATTAWEHTPLEDHSDVHWEEVTGIQDPQKITDFCVAQLGKRYATSSAILSATGTDCSLFKDDSKKFCSELCVDALQQDGILENLNAYTVTPNKLYREIQIWNAQNM